MFFDHWTAFDHPSLRQSAHDENAIIRGTRNASPIASRMDWREAYRGRVQTAAGTTSNRSRILVKTAGESMAGKLVPLRHPLTLRQALRVKRAEYWLEHGQPDEALRGLEKLPRKAWEHPWAVRVRDAAVKALREMSGQARAE